jgi:hypothetical protein
MARRSSSARASRPWVRWAGRAVVCIVLAAAGSVLWHRIALVQRGAVVPEIPQGVTHDPATKARGAVISLSGEGADPAAVYDPASGTVTVRFQSKYYDRHHSAKLNRQYLATEGRLAVQLILYSTPEVSRAVAELYRGRALLATIAGTPDQPYSSYSVNYARGVP